MRATGTLLAGRYRLGEVIGRGGMSTVYRATDETLGRTVAVKLLLPALAEQDPTYAARFEREARSAAALANSSVVTIYDTGVDDASHYIVMEYIAGRSLETLLGESRALELPEVLRIGVAVADGLAAAHAAGILHRDIKPANVMLSDDRSVKVLDFGIARSVAGTAITQVASVVGTAAYMAPERALGAPGDARADIYSLGCLLYAMLTGRPPFSGEISAAVLHQQINAEPRPPSELRPEIPPPLDGLVLATLAKSPDSRPATAAWVRDQLAGLSSGRSLPPSGVEATAPTTPLARASVPARGPLLADHRRRAVVMALLTAALTLLAVALLSGGGTSDRIVPSSRAAKTTSRHTTQPTPSRSATSSSPAVVPGRSGSSGPASGAAPPGQGATPPGQAKKHGDGGGD